MTTRTAKLSFASPSCSPSPPKLSSKKMEPKPKVDPSFKSKRYRDKLRTEVKALEGLLPVDRTALSRKLDSQTVFRLVIAFLRTQGYFQAVGLPSQQMPLPPGTQECSRTKQSRDVQETEAISLQEVIQAPTCLQVLDGFLLVLTADGTILYVSDNILQYLGYNQVDLMHRCLYSILHPEDMFDLKVILETTLGHLVTIHDQSETHQQNGGQQLEECSLGEEEISKPVSLICRMRCFSGSSVGYLKMHCSGKMVHLPGMLKGKRTSTNVVLLFCNPFMLRAAEFSTDMQKNVFWSKHDLDLNIKEMDKKSADVIGFDSEELEKQSFYSLIHPEDLASVVSCHKLLLESSEVQTVYFRLQAKGGDWVWLTSRGKVISKNSKKFSIAFSHCPLREEDSIYVQQEAILRRRYAINDLMCMVQTRDTLLQTLQQINQPQHMPHKPTKAECSRYHPYYSNNSLTYKSSSCLKSNKKDDLGSVDSNCMLDIMCPSAWHALSDRHSPVLPTSHVAHKISQREKQLQFQEFCRRQHLEDGNASNQMCNANTWDSQQYTLPVNPNIGASPGSVVAKGQVVIGSNDGDMMPMNRRGSCDVMLTNGPDTTHNAVLHMQQTQVPAELNPFPRYNYNSQITHMTYASQWHNNNAPTFSESPGGFMNNQSPGICLTPARSPLQNRVPSTYSIQAGQVATGNPASPCDTMCSFAASFSGMPPSPPPSPPSAFYMNMPSYHCIHQEASKASAINNVGHYSQPQRPEWFPHHSGSSHMSQPPAYLGLSYSTPTKASVISELQRTTEKFLQVKVEACCNTVVQSAVPLKNSYHGYHNEPCFDRTELCPMPSWMFDGTVVGAQKFCGHANLSGPAKMTRSLAEYSERFPGLPTENSPQAMPTNSNMRYAEIRMTQPHFDPNVSMVSTHWMQVNPTQSPGYGQSAYPYLCNSQPESSPFPVSHYYGNQMKMVEFPRPFADQTVALDLPSIGSFLEYLNEV